MRRGELPVPPHFSTQRTGEIWRVAYQQLAHDAEQWAKQHDIRPAVEDHFRICLIAVDVQNTFCIPGFELYVGDPSGSGAVEDTRRLCDFLYRNLNIITQTCPTVDTHRTMQIFHSIYLINDRGEHPAPFTLISEEDIGKGLWRFNPDLCYSLQVSQEFGQHHLLYYAGRLRQGGKYDLTVWPYHAMLGGIGHALVASFEEAVFFHSVARYSQSDISLKGDKPFTEHYSVLGPEVRDGPGGEHLGQKSDKFMQKLREFDAVIIAGEAKSHCVAWTVDDLLSDILTHDEQLVEKVYLLEDCSSPVVVPGVIDYTERADEAYRRFARAGMHVVSSADPVMNWPGIKL
jgi:nicotinamidase-related amidase